MTILIVDRFTERNLPPKEAFYSKLSEELNDKDYERAQKVWKHFGIRTLGQYHDLYLRTDVKTLETYVWNTTV